jgi:hypothetical protein
LLPVCLGFLVFDILSRLKVVTQFRELLLLEALVAGVFIAAATEFLNLFHALTSAAVLLFWGAVCVIVNMYRKRLPPPEPLFLGARLRGFFQKVEWDGWILLLVLAIFTSTLLAVAIVATPNNYDSMTYHLARMAHWMQEQTIAFYGTNNARQNFMPPLAEWTMLHLTLLQGDNRLVNLVQWFSYGGCILGTSLITELLGGSRRDGIIAAFFVATLSGAIFESTSTQNDLVMSFWLVCAVYGCIKLSLQPGWPATLVFGASVGLAFLTKTLALIFGAPLYLWAFWTLALRHRENAVPRLTLIACIALTLNAGQLSRNVASTGHLLGPGAEQGEVPFINETFVPSAIFSTILRNVSLHANLFGQKSHLETMVINIHRALGLDPQDPRTTLNRSTYSITDWGEDSTPMPIHLVAILLSSAIIIWKRGRFSTLPFELLASLLAGALFFCIVLKWSPFHARLHLALFIMSAPLVGLALGSLSRRIFSLPILFSFLIAALPDVFLYPPRSVMGPLSIFVTSSDFQQLFRQPQLVQPYMEMQRILDYNQVNSVGLILKQDDWEYPLETTERLPAAWRTDHLLIENAYSSLETTQVPEVALCTRPKMGDSLTIHGQVFKLARVYETPAHEFILSLYIRDGLPFSLPQ